MVIAMLRWVGVIYAEMVRVRMGCLIGVETVEGDEMGGRRGNVCDGKK